MTEHKQSRVLLLGHTGRIGSPLRRLLEDGCELHAPSHVSAPLEDFDALIRACESAKPELIINCAAFTDVEAAERTHTTKANVVNGNAPGVLAEWARRNDAVLFHMSSDYVLAGDDPRPQPESAPTRPVNVYGRSKLQGEANITQVDGVHFICRTAWIYDRGSPNFVTRIIGQAHEGASIPVVADQWGSPTWADSAARMLAEMVFVVTHAERDWARSASGIFHVANNGNVSRAELARQALQVARCPASASIRETHSTELPGAVRRPKHSALDVSKLGEVFGLTAPGWKDALAMAFDNATCG